MCTPPHKGSVQKQSMLDKSTSRNRGDKKMELQIFNDNRLGSIRAMVIDKEPYFVGKDVTEALGYSNPRDALARHVDPEDAYGVGSDMGAGLGGGLDSQRSWLMRKAGNLVSDMIARMRASADSDSPSKETMGLGEDMGEGTGIGLEKKTKFLMEIAQDQVDGLLDVYSGQKNLAGQAVFRGLQAASSRRQEQGYQTMANSTSEKLDSILAAIEKGQVIYLDGDKLVGGTTTRMDASLGRQRILVERGAI